MVEFALLETEQHYWPPVRASLFCSRQPPALLPTVRPMWRIEVRVLYLVNESFQSMLFALTYCFRVLAAALKSRELEYV